MAHLTPMCLLALGVLSAGTARAEKPAPLTDAELAKVYGEKVAGAKLDPKCTLRSTAFPGFVKLGQFAYDRGCKFDLLLLDGTKLDLEKDAKDILARGGWNNVDAPAKEKLGWAYIRDVEGAEPMRVEPSAFKKLGKKFEQPSATPRPDGGVTLRFWLSLAKGKQPMARYKLVEQSFALDGSPGEEQALEGFAAHH